MKKPTIIGSGVAAAAAFALGAAVLANPGAQSIEPVQSQTQQSSGLHVSEGRLYEGNGNEFVIRGVSHPHVWYPQEFQSFEGIKSHGANTVRVVLGSGHQWGPNTPEDVAGVVEECKEQRLICMLEVHDATGYGEDSNAASMDEVVDYWLDIADVLHGEEDYVLINIANEPYGNNEEVNANWASDTTDAIGTLREAGFDHAFVVDAPNWGQDWQQIMLNEAPDVVDPHDNTVFSIHMYGVYEQESVIADYLNTFLDHGLPLIIGEFGHDHSDGTPDEDAIMAHAESLGLGYIGWSWSGNSGGVEYLDMVNGFDADSLTPWGERIFYGENGIAETAQEATVFGDPNGDNGSGDNGDNGNGDPGEAECTLTVIGSWQGGFQAEIEVTNTGDAPTSAWGAQWTFPGGQEVTQMWGGDYEQSGAQVSVANAAYNGELAPGASATAGFIGSGDGEDFEPDGLECSLS
jgi:mannan endo-1,4-beta-mannosidase